jgi:hypothetical protein
MPSRRIRRRRPMPRLRHARKRHRTRRHRRSGPKRRIPHRRRRIRQHRRARKRRLIPRHRRSGPKRRIPRRRHRRRIRPHRHARNRRRIPRRQRTGPRLPPAGANTRASRAESASTAPTRARRGSAAGSTQAEKRRPEGRLERALERPDQNTYFMPTLTPCSLPPNTQWGAPPFGSKPDVSGLLASWQSVVTPWPPAPRSKWASGWLRVVA